MVFRNIKHMFCMGLTGVMVLGMLLCGETAPKVFGDVSARQDVVIDENTFPDSTFRQWILDVYDTDGDSRLSPTELAQLEMTGNMNAFSASDRNAVRDWTGIEYFTGITEFSLVGGIPQAETLDLRKNANLEILMLNGARNLTALEVSGLANLKTLECAAASIRELDLSGLGNLQRLACPETSLERLDVSGLNSLQLLICYNTHIQELDVSRLSNLIAIMCYDTPITELNVSGLNNLTHINCNNTSVTELNVTGLSHLNKLECRNTPITVLDVSGLTALTELDCAGCQLTALDLSHNNMLGTSLSVSGQRVPAPLYYDGSSYYVDVTEFPDMDKTRIETVGSLGSPYSYDSSQGKMECQGALNPGDELYYNYDTGISTKMQVIIEISEVIDLTASTTEGTTEAPSTSVTESDSSTETETEASTTETISTVTTTELPESSASTLDSAVSATGTGGNNVQKQDTPKTGDVAIIVWIGMLGIFAVVSFMITSRKK